MCKFSGSRTCPQHEGSRILLCNNTVRRGHFWDGESPLKKCRPSSSCPNRNQSLSSPLDLLFAGSLARSPAVKMMHMTLYWSVQVTLLVDSWRTDSWPSYILTLLACAVSSAFYQYLEDRRLRLRSAAAAVPAPTSTEPSPASPLIPKLSRLRLLNKAKLASTALFGFNSAIGYLLMLAIMSFNGGVFLSIVAGLTVGYWLFRCEDEELPAVENPCACA